MSSPPASPSTSRRRRYEPWRKVMLVGALILLANSLGNALIEGSLPTWASFLLTFAGYGFLTAGFGMRMRAMKEARDLRAEGAGSEARKSSADELLVPTEDQPEDDHGQDQHPR